MKIKNTQAEALPSNITPQELGKAMAQLDLSSIPEHRRSEAIMDHLMRIMADSIQDQKEAQIIHMSRIMRQKDRK